MFLYKSIPTLQFKAPFPDLQNTYFDHHAPTSTADGAESQSEVSFQFKADMGTLLLKLHCRVSPRWPVVYTLTVAHHRLTN